MYCVDADTGGLYTAALDEDGVKFVGKKYVESTIGEDYLELISGAMKGASQIRKLNKYFEQAGFTNEDYIAEMENSGVEGAVPISFVIPLEYRLNEDAVDVSIPMCAYAGSQRFRFPYPFQQWKDYVGKLFRVCVRHRQACG